MTTEKPITRSDFDELAIMLEKTPQGELDAMSIRAWQMRIYGRALSPEEDAAVVKTVNDWAKDMLDSIDHTNPLGRNARTRRDPTDSATKSMGVRP